MGCGLQRLLLQFIGQGASYCTARNCNTAHHHSLVKTVKPGEIYVAKSSSTAFVTPSITDSVIDSDVLAVWRALTLTLPEWNQKFFIATAALDDDVPVSSAAMEVHETFFRTKALNFKTPAKRKRGLEDEDDSPMVALLDVSLYSPFFKADEEAPITEISHVTGVLARLDDGIHANNSGLLSFMTEYRQEHGKAGSAIRSLHLRLEALTSTVGSVPSHLAFDYLAPSTWASIGAMAEKLDEIGKSVSAQGARLDTYKAEVRASVEEQTKSIREDFYTKLDSFKGAFILATRGLGGRLDNVELSVMGLVSQAQASSTTIRLSQETDPHSGLGRAADDLSRDFHRRPSREADPHSEFDDGGEDMERDFHRRRPPSRPGPDPMVLESPRRGGSRIDSRIDGLEWKLNGLVVATDEKAIMFAGLGFQSIGESNAWLEIELKRHQSGLIVDAHIVFEHVYHAINGVETIAAMEKLYKIKVR